MKLLLSILFLLPLVLNAQLFSQVIYVSGHNYYVSSSGSDGNNGISPATAWKTIAKVNSTTFSPGDTIHFKGGETFTGNLLMQNSGTITNRIAIVNYGTGRPQINCSDGNGVNLLNCEYVTVDSMYVQGSGIDTATGAYTTTGYGIGATSTYLSGNRFKGVVIKNSIIIGCRYGVMLQANASVWPQTTYRGYDSAVISGNDISLCGSTGILLYASSDTWSSDPMGALYNSNSKTVHKNIIVQRNNVHDMYGFISTTTGLNNGGTGIRFMSVDSGLVEYNRVDNGGHIGSSKASPANFEAEVSQNITWQYNESSRCTWRGTVFYDGAGFDVFDGGTSNMLLQYNYAHDNDGYGIGGGGTGGGADSGNTIGNIARFNILVNNNTKGLLGDIQCWGGYSNYKFYNNTVYSSLNGSQLISISAPVTTSYFSNNIFISTGTRKILNCTSTPPTFANNLYYRGASNDSLGLTVGGVTYNTLAAFNASGYEKISGTNYGVKGNPLFVNIGAHANFLMGANISTMTDYDLQSGSAAKNAGLPMSSIAGFNEGTKDFHSTIFTNITNIGAIQ